jgi:hypothetical protein
VCPPIDTANSESKGEVQSNDNDDALDLTIHTLTNNNEGSEETKDRA